MEELTVKGAKVRFRERTYVQGKWFKFVNNFVKTTRYHFLFVMQRSLVRSTYHQSPHVKRRTSSNRYRGELTSTNMIISKLNVLELERFLSLLAG